MSAIAVPVADGAESAEQLQVHLRAVGMVAVADTAGTGPALAYVDWSQQELAIAAAPLPRPAHDGRLHVGRLLPDVREDGRRGATGRHEANARSRTRPIQNGGVRRVVRLERRGLARKLGEPLHRGPRAARYAQAHFRRFWEWSDAWRNARYSPAHCGRCSVGASASAQDANPRSLRNFPMQSDTVRR